MDHNENGMEQTIGIFYFYLYYTTFVLAVSLNSEVLLGFELLEDLWKLS